MIDDRHADQLIKAWIDSGPDAASSEFVERTLRPVPLMRQRRSWRIAVGGLTGRFAPLAAAVAVLAIAVVGASTLMRGLPSGTGPGTAPSPSPPLGTSRPTFELTFGEGATAQVFRSDPAASVATCNVRPDGPSYALYAGGDPFVNIDLLVGIGAGKPGGAGRVAAEISAGDIYVRFDPAVLRGGDAPGRSQASVTIRSDGAATTFEVIATTPDTRDGSPIRVSMSLTCAP